MRGGVKYMNICLNKVKTNEEEAFLIGWDLVLQSNRASIAKQYQKRFLKPFSCSIDYWQQVNTHARGQWLLRIDIPCWIPCLISLPPNQRTPGLKDQNAYGIHTHTLLGCSKMPAWFDAFWLYMQMFNNYILWILKYDYNKWKLYSLSRYVKWELELESSLLVLLNNDFEDII